MTDDALRRAEYHARSYLDSLPQRPVSRAMDAAVVRERVAGPLPAGPVDPVQVVDELVAAVDPGLIASPGPRYFGFVIGGSVPAALAADWLVSAWDQNAFSAISSPAAAAVEEVALDWLRDLLAIPDGSAGGFVTGATGGNITGLAAARQGLLGPRGWDVAERGLQGAPPLRVLVGEGVHVSVLRALRVLGLGASAAERIAADDQGRMLPERLEEALGRGDGAATIVCAQAGEVNTGAIDPLEDVAALAAGAGAWLHVDGAFGLWAAASPALRSLVAGCERADSWATDAHKWLNVPYDCGLVFVRDPDAHHAALSMTASYIASEGLRNPFDWVPEASRRARGIPVYAALRSLGRSGVAELVERCCRHARLLAAELDGRPGLRVVNDVVLNQVLVRLDDPDRTAATAARIQSSGRVWLGTTVWQSEPAIRVSFSNWSTGDEAIALLAEELTA
jgi:glutamate/tyrosine decarboxylase-like PLP-dependent enzyme